MTVIERKFNEDKKVVKVFTNTSFGSSTPYEVIIDTLDKISRGYSTGHTACTCAKELGYLTKSGREYAVTVKGTELMIERTRCEMATQNLKVMQDMAIGIDTGLIKALENYIQTHLKPHKTHDRPIGDAILCEANDIDMQLMYTPNGQVVLFEYGTDRVYPIDILSTVEILTLTYRAMDEVGYVEDEM